MTIEKGKPWGTRAPLNAEGVVVDSDASARAVVEAARRSGRPPPPLGLLGGDLWRTLGAPQGQGRLRSEQAMTFPVDLGEALLDGRLHLFVAHLVARNRLWTRAFVVMNAQWLGPLNLGPRAHPGDGLLDTYDATLSFGGLWAVRARSRTGSHLPHPGILERRAPAVQVSFPRPLEVFLDGVHVSRVRHLSVRVEPDALSVVV